MIYNLIKYRIQDPDTVFTTGQAAVTVSVTAESSGLKSTLKAQLKQSDSGLCSWLQFFNFFLKFSQPPFPMTLN